MALVWLPLLALSTIGSVSHRRYCRALLYTTKLRVACVQFAVISVLAAVGIASLVGTATGIVKMSSRFVGYRCGRACPASDSHAGVFLRILLVLWLNVGKLFHMLLG